MVNETNLTANKTVQGTLTQIKNLVYSIQPWQWVVIFSIIGLIAIIIWYFKRREKIRKEAIKIHDIFRELKDKLRKARETYDSRTQWEFQEEDSYDSMSKLKDKISELEKKGDWWLGKLMEKRENEVKEIKETLSKWADKKPDYYNKKAYVRDVRHILDILKRW